MQELGLKEGTETWELTKDKAENREFLWGNSAGLHTIPLQYSCNVSTVDGIWVSTVKVNCV